MSTTPEPQVSVEGVEERPPEGTLGRFWRMGYFALPTGDEQYHALAVAVNVAIFLRMPSGFTRWEDIKGSVTIADGHLCGVTDVYNGLGIYPAELSPPIGVGNITRCLSKRGPVSIPVMIPTFPGHHSVLIVGRDEDIFYVCGWETGQRVSEVPVWDIAKQLEWREKWPWLAWYGRVWGKL